jgi:acetyl-CoA carboxylase carboxyl transferase subunit beta
MPIKLPSFRPRKDAYPPDLWTKCPSCSEMLFNKQLDKADRVCPSCGHHFRLSAEARLALLLDPHTFHEEDAGLQSVDPLGFVDQKPYPDRIAAAQLATGLRDAAVRGTGVIDGRRVSICVMDFGFMGGSMGAVVGEKVTRAAEQAMAERIPLVIVSASGGARMQEGTLALMQLAKTCAALERARAAGIPYVSVMTDPTTGGVFASYAVLGDINLAEPNALIGFAGARVSAGTIAQELPPGFQRTEFLFEHGFIDRIVHRRELRAEIGSLLRYLVPAERPESAADPRTGFDPIGFLTSLAERVVPDLGPLEEPPAPGAPAPASSGTDAGTTAESTAGATAARRRGSSRETGRG